MKIVKAFKENYSLEALNGHKVFLAGGCAVDWRGDLIRYCHGDSKATEDLVLYNPYFDGDCDWNELIGWEQDKMQKADTLVFWFSRGSLNAMTMFELGKYIHYGKKLVIGFDKDYEKIDSVLTQIKLVKPEQKICGSLIQLFDEMTDY